MPYNQFKNFNVLDRLYLLTYWLISVVTKTSRRRKTKLTQFVNQQFFSHSLSFFLFVPIIMIMGANKDSVKRKRGQKQPQQQIIITSTQYSETLIYLLVQLGVMKMKTFYLILLTLPAGIYPSRGNSTNIVGSDIFVPIILHLAMCFLQV